MATKKPKSSNKSNKPNSTKPKNTHAESAHADAAPQENNVTHISSSYSSSSSSKSKDTSSKSADKSSDNSDSSSEDASLKSFFAKKYEGHESILTIFKQRKLYGALLGEVIGTLLITLLLFSLSLMGMASLATYSFVVIGTLIGVYAFSGACLNPLITVGMMASRRMSVIRGICYIIAEVIGAWLGWLIFNAFHLAGGENAYVDVPVMAEIAEGQFWLVAMIELMGSIIIAFFFARALKYKRSLFTFGAVVAGGLGFAMLLGYVVSAAFVNLQSNFLFNPATALMYQIFPTSGDDFSQIIGGICQALAVYALFPMIGGVLGFYLSDFTARLSGEAE